MKKMEMKSFELIEELNDKRRIEYILRMEYEEFKRIMNMRLYLSRRK